MEHGSDQRATSSIAAVVPREINVLEFVKKRAADIADILSVIDNATLPAGEVGQGPKTFIQRLPRHMRRRAMSYNVKRLPRRAQESALAFINTSTHKKHPPSRKHRRRPKNLLTCYAQRQRRVNWMETHIWHARRFHMGTEWNWRIPYRSTQRGFRATHRDTVRHAVVLDKSYMVCIEIRGSRDQFLRCLVSLCPAAVGTSFAFKPTLTGNRAGTTFVYEPNQYPNGAIGPVEFLWAKDPEDVSIDILWIWAHPSMLDQVLIVLSNIFSATETHVTKEDTPLGEDQSSEVKLKDVQLNQISINTRQFVSSTCAITVLSHCLSRYRLVGPESGRILYEALHLPCVNELRQICNSNQASNQSNSWWMEFYANNTARFEKLINENQIWTNGFSHTAIAMPSGSITPVLIRDPRLFLAFKRHSRNEAFQYDPVKSKLNWFTPKNAEIELPFLTSPLFSSLLRQRILSEKVSQTCINAERSAAKMLSTECPSGAHAVSFSSQENLVPLIIVRAPGGISGYDVISPRGWGLPAWLALQYGTARACGMHDELGINREKGLTSFPMECPDCQAGQSWDTRASKELQTKYDRRPWNRRPNFSRIKSLYPFEYPWDRLVSDWRTTSTKDPQAFYVLRDRRILASLNQMTMNVKPKPNQRSVPSISLDQLIGDHGRSLIRVTVTVKGKGCPKPHAMLCLLEEKDRICLSQKRPSIMEETLQKDEPQQMIDVVASGFSVHKRKLQSSSPKMSDVCSEESSDGSSDSNDQNLMTSLLFDQKDARVEHRKRKRRRKRQAARNANEPKSGIDTGNAEGSGDDNVSDSCSRKIIGYLTSGDVSLTTGKLIGHGFCVLTPLVQLLQKDLSNSVGSFPRGIPILFRNPASRLYRLAFVQINVHGFWL